MSFYGWQSKIIKREQSMTNSQLVDEVIRLTDECETLSDIFHPSKKDFKDVNFYYVSQESWELAYMEKMLRERLIQAGFIDPSRRNTK
jgi:hypothetical protein